MPLATTLTPAQRAVWVASEIDPDNASDFHLGWTTRFADVHDLARLVDAIERVLRKDQRLSETILLEEEAPRWAACAAPARPATIDLRAAQDPDLAVAERVARVRERVALGTGGPLHSHEILLVPGGYVWAQAYHHVLVDGRSIHELTRRVLADLDGTAESPDDLPSAPPSSIDTGSWDSVISALDTVDDGLAERPTRVIESVSIDLDPDMVASFPALAARCGLSVGRVVAGLLSAYTMTVRGPGPHAVRLAVAGAGPRHAITMRSAVLPLVTTVDHETTVDTHLRAFDDALRSGLRRHSADPDAAVRALRARFGESVLTAPGINVMLGPDRPDGVLRSAWVGPSTDLELVAEGEVGLGRLRIVVRGRADRTELASHAAALSAFLSSAVRAPEGVLDGHRLVHPAERRLLLTEQNDTGRCLSDRDVVDMVFARADQAPASVAVIDGDRAVDYRHLLGAATHIARRLRDEFGAVAESVIAVDMHRSAEMVASLLGVLMAGAAFVPLDPAWPQRRRSTVLADSGARAVLVGPGAGGSTGLPSHHVNLDEVDPPADVVSRDAESLAYVIFTSGSTGAPKGAMIRHSAIASRMRWQIEDVLGFGADDASLFKAPLSFDISINEVLLPLCAGGTVVVARDGEEREPERLLHLIAEHGVTFTYLVASMLDVLLDTDAETDAPQLGGLRHVWCGGELLTPELFDRFRLQLPAATMYHGYGPAEATIGVSHIVYGRDGVRSTTSIGRPNPGCQLYVLDRALRPVPAGMGGELYAAGDLLGRGYVNAPALTAARFIANPFHDRHDPASTERLYRTGDRARWNGDELEFLGRADHQVKIGGMRVELEEIERTIAAAPGVRACVAIVRAACVHAYVVPASGASASEVEASALRQAAENLPRHMVPTWITALATLPTTANGKVDRTALPEPKRTPPGTHELSAVEQRIAGAFAEVLGVDIAEIGPTSGFFARGGDSLAAVRVAHRLSRALGRRVPSRAVFEHPTLAGLSEFVARAEHSTSAVEIVASDGPATMQASPGQRRMWLSSQLATAAASYTVPLAFLFEREPDRDVLQAALAATTRRHPALRTLLFPEGGAVTAQRLAADDPRSAPRLELATDPDEFVRRPFDLASTPPIRAALTRVPDGWLFLLAIHHSATDEASEPVLLHTLSEAVRARQDGAAPRGETAAVLHAPSGESAADALARLGPLPDAADIPGWRSLPAGFGRAGRTRARTLTGPSVDALRHRRTDASVFELALRAVASAVERLGGPSSMLIAAPVARTTPDDGVVGCNVTTTLFAVGRDSELRGQIVSALDACADIADLVSAAPELRDRAAPRLMVVHQSRRLDRLVLGEHVGTRVPITTGTAKFDATVTVAEVGDDVTVELEYAVEAIDADEADRFLRHVCAALCSPDTLSDLALDEVDTATAVLLEGPDEIEAGHSRTLTDLVASGASEEAHRIAGALAAEGIGPGSVVGVCAARSARQVDLVHAVVLAGAAYVPIDPAWPAARRGAVVTDSGADLVLEDAPRASTAPTTSPHPDDAAYVLFTSGSTGRPKGVVVSHRAIVNRLLAAPDLHGITADDVILYKTPFTFDVSLWELFLPAIVGARQAIAPPDAHRDPSATAAAIVDARATVVHFVPSVLASFLDYLSGAPEVARAVARSVRLVVCSGEALTAHHLRQFSRVLPQVRVDNLYGPTEAAVDVTAAIDVSDTTPIGIGLPFPGVSCRILNRRLRPVVPGAAGDLYLSGVQLARGYSHRPALTAERFVADPFVVGARMYDTGDRARQRPDGTIEYLGRRDNQVKVGGQRIELGEVESALTSAPGVESAAAFVVDGTVVAVYTGRAESDAVRSHAAGVVPSALVPARLTAVPSLPVTPHGKLDRASLPMLDQGPTVVGGRAPESPTETALCEVFADALGAASAPANVDFFALGGDSISAIAVVTAAHRRGLAISVIDLFEARTVEALAARCAPLRAHASKPAAADASATAEPVPVPAAIASAKRDGTDIDAMTVSAPLAIADAESAQRALSTVAAARPELRVRLDRSRARLWRAFQLKELPAGNTVDVAAGRLAVIDTSPSGQRLVVHRMALLADEKRSLQRLIEDIHDAARLRKGE
ncbi:MULTISPECIES: non-ribosomal peptide synthetase [unclassified Rathayibacter]|uniref:non-ribosomal peptide synthetase n=1 Tax=unclassified Rathayibacter TaxID=2609250 RepID=UPI00188D7F27|nr:MULTISPECIES: non-ribosomal peptide synthetase [unclassified Rathayibacter]MBF4462603.1 amino acid adenylation domain-containing protein [Rathayibacter sp. VKM Ac-2879]MBF4503354.1 amino acid adenylation domain-containing protein [Rathayibacter sp. VKM Ac-2878]